MKKKLKMAATHVGASKHARGIQTYREVSKHMGVIQTYRVPSKHVGIETYRRCIQTYGASKHTVVHQNIWGHQNIQGASKHCSRLKSVASSATHMGATRHTAGHPNIWVVSKHGACKHTRGHPNL